MRWQPSSRHDGGARHKLKAGSKRTSGIFIDYRIQERRRRREGRREGGKKKENNWQKLKNVHIWSWNVFKGVCVCLKCSAPTSQSERNYNKNKKAFAGGPVSLKHKEIGAVRVITSSTKLWSGVSASLVWVQVHDSSFPSFNPQLCKVVPAATVIQGVLALSSSQGGTYYHSSRHVWLGEQRPPQVKPWKGHQRRQRRRRRVFNKLTQITLED